MTYSLQNIQSSQSPEVPFNPFILNQTTGELILSANYEVDHGQQSIFHFKLTATDSGHLSASSIIVVNIQNINDNSPTCSHQTIYFPLCVPLGVPILNLTADDMDGSMVSFELSSCNSSTNSTEETIERDCANNIFSLSVNGTLSQKRNVSGGTYHLNIGVVDIDGLTGSCVVSVYILQCGTNGSFEKGESSFESPATDSRGCRNEVTLSWALPLCIVTSAGVSLTLTFYFWYVIQTSLFVIQMKANFL
jgi:hypothetical protein